MHELFVLVFELFSALHRAQLSIVMRTMIDDEFPSSWPNVMDEMTQYVTSHDTQQVCISESYCAALYQCT